MRRNLTRSLATLIVCGALACASVESTAYKSIGTIVTAVDGTMQVYGDMVRAGKVTADQQAKVHKAYDEYIKALSVAQASVLAYKYSAVKDPSVLNQAVALLSGAAAAVQLLIAAKG